MRYCRSKEKTLQIVLGQFAKPYECDHVVYSRCTLYKINGLGMAVIQQRYNCETKATTWTDIDVDLIDEIYLHPKFFSFFQSFAKEQDEKGLYPTITVRQLMWNLRMKPMKREPWETYFDKKGF